MFYSAFTYTMILVEKHFTAWLISGLVIKINYNQESSYIKISIFPDVHDSSNQEVGTLPQLTVCGVDVRFSISSCVTQTFPVV